jgi:hypothetical protein
MVITRDLPHIPNWDLNTTDPRKVYYDLRRQNGDA